MTRTLLLSLLLAAPLAHASEKETDYNTRYVETEADRRRAVFTETEEPLPPFPTADGWTELYVSPTYPGQLLISRDSIHPAADRTVRYVLNLRPQHGGTDNISAEALYCAASSFNIREGKKSAYKTYAYGDPVNRRWIAARNARWQNLGGRPDSAAAVRETLYRIWCHDGTPETREGLLRRLDERGGKNAASGRQNRKESD